jgi:crotonobetainyl-CoA:carnitine CoA-transferase CaiB-like acyl-CoA transferase
VTIAALSELLALGDIAPGGLEVTGADPVFPTRFRIGAAGAAVIAAAAMAAAEIWSHRSSRARQRVAVDLRHAAASLRSTRYLRIDATPPKEPFDPLSGLYETRDGWIFLHCNFPNHRAAALGVLGLGEGAAREAVAGAMRRWEGLALEDAVHAAGGCAGLVRSAEAWQHHPQSPAVAALPLIAIERIADAPPEPLPREGTRPLAGIRVLDLTRVLAGPTCARTLAEHGADVLKVSGPHLAHSGEIEIDTGLGKLSCFLDLRRRPDADALAALVRDGRADVFSQGYRPGTLAARGFGAEEVAALRPGTVYVELSAWGLVGPWAARRGFDTIVQCVSGMAMIQGGDQPRLLPVSAIDYVSGHLMAFGAMVALERRARQGGSWRVRVSLARTARWIAAQGLLAPDDIADVRRELPEEEIAAFGMETPSPLGLIRHLKPVARMDETPPRWARPPVPLGHDPAAWPPRGGNVESD